MFVLIYTLYYPSIFLTLQIRIFIIAGAVEIKFVSYNAQLLLKDVLGKLSLCAPFYRPYGKRSQNTFHSIQL